MKHTEHEMKLALVLELPGMLEPFTPDLGETYFRWTVNQMFVAPHEWLRIVQMVEEKAPQGYVVALAKAVAKKHGIKYPDDVCDAYLIIAPWQVRAQALADIGAITIV